MDTIMPEGKNYVDRWVWDEETQSYSENTPDPFFNPPPPYFANQLTFLFK